MDLAVALMVITLAHRESDAGAVPDSDDGLSDSDSDDAVVALTATSDIDGGRLANLVTAYQQMLEEFTDLAEAHADIEEPRSPGTVDFLIDALGEMRRLLQDIEIAAAIQSRAVELGRRARPETFRAAEALQVNADRLLDVDDGGRLTWPHDWSEMSAVELSTDRIDSHFEHLVAIFEILRGVPGLEHVHVVVRQYQADVQRAVTEWNRWRDRPVPGPAEALALLQAREDCHKVLTTAADVLLGAADSHLIPQALIAVSEWTYGRMAALDQLSAQRHTEFAWNAERQRELATGRPLRLQLAG
ncbi:hypothetical protein [Lentzea sp. E54]|uniref:hypothetical protein n=1 Tax=Lentzea xerophila TaxID=3435883 RepID=UPI003DA3C99F